MKLAAFVLNLASIFVSAFVLMKLWNWFPHVTLGIAELTFVGAIGINLVLIFFKNMHVPKKNAKVDDDENLHKAATLFLTYWLILGVGYIVNLFM